MIHATRKASHASKLHLLSVAANNKKSARCNDDENINASSPENDLSGDRKTWITFCRIEFMWCDQRHRTRQSICYRLITNLYQQTWEKQAKNNSIQNVALVQLTSVLWEHLSLQTRQNCENATNLTVSGEFDDGESNAANGIKKFPRNSDENRVRKSNRLEFRRTLNVE